MKFSFASTKKFDRAYNKLNIKDRELLDDVILKLCENKKLESKYKDHKLKGSLKKLRECHVKPDLLLIYDKMEDLLILKAINLGSHSELF